jgi:hypothetical protein
MKCIFILSFNVHRNCFPVLCFYYVVRAVSKLGKSHRFNTKRFQSKLEYSNLLVRFLVLKWSQRLPPSISRMYESNIEQCGINWNEQTRNRFIHSSSLFNSYVSLMKISKK